ncbi:MAG TPA: DUF2339 domain-containing protein [Thermoanaerobaculia bacterium]|jgi:hypothetical protein|nr:DUF2339 domain-containing protein [Thermoanaerobaculia bacterium]
MDVVLVLAVLIIALVVAKRTLWRHYEPEASSMIHRFRSLDWTATGIRVFSWIDGIALMLAAVYFVRSRPHGSWLAVAIGLGIGIALLLVSAALVRRYGLTADAVDGAGIGILYVTCYAMHVRWNLVPLPLALIAMLLVTAAAGNLATRRGSFFIAILGLIGGFAMPALLSFNDRPLELFTYLLLLNAGVSWIAYRMRWPLLVALSVARTTIYEWTWVMQSLTSTQLRFAALIFASFAIVAAAPFWYRPWDEYPPRFRQIASVAMLLPLLFAFFIAANTNYGEQYNVLFGFLLVIAASLFITVWRGGPGWLHIAGGIATLVTFFLWFLQWGREWHAPDSLPPQPVPGLVLMVTVWVALFIALYLVRTRLIAAVLFLVFIGLAIRQPEDYVTLIVGMLSVLAAALLVLIARGNPIPGAIAIGLCAKALMVLNPLSPLYMTYVSHTLNPPPVPWIVIAAFAILFGALFAVASILDVPILAILAIPFYAAMLITVYAPTAAGQLWLAVVPYALFVVYAFFPGTRARAALAPYIALLLASIVFLISAAVTVHSIGGIAGIVPLIEAVILLALLGWVARLEPVEPRSSILLTSVLAFFNAAILLLLPAAWIVVALAIEAVVLIWLFARFAYRGFLVWSVGLAAVLVLWITFDAGLCTYVDTYKLFAYIFGFSVALCAGSMLFAGIYVVRPDMLRLRLLFSLAGLVESWYLVNILIANAYHSTGVVLNIEFMNFAPREDVTFTIAWAVIATGLLFIGLHWDWQGARVGATGLLILAILKCFLHDLVRRGDPYRVASLLGVAVSLLVVGVILQRYTSRNASASVAA